MKRLFQLLAFYLVLLWLGAMLAVGNFCALLLYYPLPRPYAKRWGRLANSFIFRCFLSGCVYFKLMDLELDALDSLNQEKSLIIAPNHPSMVDVFLVLSRVRECACLMKPSLWNHVLLGAGARLAGYIRSDSATKMIRIARDDLRLGGKLLVFPEGTRTVGQPFADIKSGAALMAQKANCPIQIVLIHTNSAYLSKGWPIWRAPVFPVRIKIELGRRIFPLDSAANTFLALEQALRQSFPPLSNSN